MEEKPFEQEIVISKECQQEAIEATSDVVVPGEDATEDEAEEFANKIVRRAASLRAVKIDRDVFLRTELRKR